MDNKIKIFENKKIRAIWDAEKEDWYFSVVDVVAVLTDTNYQRAQNYWYVLKNRLRTEGSELLTFCKGLKIKAPDGKMRETTCLDTKGVLRLVQSIPSPKAEPFKVWLANVGAERLDEIADPEKAMQRGADFYRAKGYTPEWITQRLLSIKIRKDLTDEMTKAWSGLSVREYKNLKGLKKENLRDNMTDMELVLNMLAEITTTTLSKQEQPKTFAENKNVAKAGGETAKEARQAVEKRTGKSAISPLNATDKPALQVKDENKK